jgi:hypothetical protein
MREMKKSREICKIPVLSKGGEILQVMVAKVVSALRAAQLSAAEGILMS